MQLRPIAIAKWVLPVPVGLGKTHLSIALGHAACLNGHAVLFTTAVDIINTLAAQSAGRLKREFQRYLKPAVLIVYELGYLSHRQARRRLAVPDHQPALRARPDGDHHQPCPHKHWSQIFNNDSTLTSAILDRVLHHAETVVIRRQELPHEGRD